MGVFRTKIKWSIPGAGTAYSVLHFGAVNGGAIQQGDVDEAIPRLTTYLNAFKQHLPNTVSAQVMNEAEELSPGTGEMLGFYSGPAQPVVAGGAVSTATWAAAAGAVISWSTAGVRNGRRVRGRTFIVPIAGTAFATDGTLSANAMNDFNTAATGLRTAGALSYLAIYARPSAPGATDGAFYTVTGHRVPDMSAILRSRRS